MYNHRMNRPIVQDIVRIVVIAFVGLAMFWAGLWIWGDWNDEWSGFNAQFTVSDGYCNIAVVPIVGDITTLPYPEEDPEDPANQYPTATEDDILYQLRLAESFKSSPLPVAALIREYGVSGGYLAATGADTIFASPLSDVGSIGITMSYLENVGKNTKN